MAAIGSNILELTGGKDVIFSQSDFHEVLIYSLRFIKFSLEFDDKQQSHSSLISPKTSKILLTTMDSSDRPIYVHSFMTYLKYYQFLPKQAQLCTEVLSRVLHQPGIHRTLTQELEGNEFRCPFRCEGSLENESDFVTLVRKSIDELISTDPMSISLGSTSSIMSTDCNSSRDNEELVSTTDLTNTIDKLIQHFIDNKTSLQELERLAVLLNSVPGARVTLPTTRYLLMKEMQSKCLYDCATYILCSKCKVYTKKAFFSPDVVQCKQCCSQIISKDSKSIIYIYIEAQLKSILLNNWESVIGYQQTIRDKNNSNIEDVYDGIILKNIMKDNDYVLSLTVNTDGVSYEKSNRKSVWHLQLLCNFLPPQIRFNIENIILCGIYYGEKKPNLLQFFEPLGEEMQNLQMDGFTANDIIFKVFIAHGSFDLPAKAQAQNTVQFNGYDGCGYCYHHGVAFGKTVLFPNEENIAKLRSHEEMIAAMEKVHQSRKELCVLGVKGISPMIVFDGFDLVYSFGVDYMHNSLLGNVKACLKLWLSPKNKDEPYYIQKAGREELNKRISALKLCIFFKRKPRTMLYLHQFKASEYRAMLLYYLGICLDGILREKYLKHFRMLSSAIYTLLGTSISPEEKEDATGKLENFVQLFQEYYGPNKMTMNVHMLKHTSKSVDYLGPLWSYSMFSFESNNGILGTYFNGSRDITKQIALRYILKRSQNVSEKHNQHRERNICQILEPKIVIKLSSSEIAALNEKQIAIQDSQKFVVYERFHKDNVIYTSVQYKKAKKSIDYFVAFGYETIGKILFYFFHNNTQYAMIDEFSETDRKDHIREIKFTKKSVVRSVDITEKYVYMKINARHFVALPPNNFEKD